MDQSWKQEKGPRRYRVVIQHWTHTLGEREKMQERKEVFVEAPDHRPRLAAITAGCPKTAKTMATGYYTTEVHVCDIPKDQKIRNWTSWHVQPVYAKTP